MNGGGATEAPDLKNGASEPTKRTEKKIEFVFSDTSVFSVFEIR